MTDINLLIIAASELLKERSYLENTIIQYNLVWSRLVEYMNDLSITGYTAEVGDNYLQNLFGDYEYSSLSKKQREIIRKIQVLSEFQATGLLAGARKDPAFIYIGEIGTKMQEYLNTRIETGYSENTLKGNRYYLRSLLTFLVKQKANALNSLSPALINSFIESLTDTTSTTKYNFFTCTKKFLKFLHSSNNDIPDLSTCIPKINYIRQAKLPSVYSNEEIDALLKAIDRANPKGKRDYAIMLIAARLGLRASDIIGLTFANIHWQDCLIVIEQKKTNNPIELPLLSEIGDAVIDYLKYGRPHSKEPYIFLSLVAPYGQLTNVFMSETTSRYLTMAGIDTSTRKHGAHIFRHSLAAQLFGKMTPIHTISEVLGHSTTDSTNYYIRIDIKAMEPCALNVPLVSPTFYVRITDFFFPSKEEGGSI